ncbi:MAG: DnaA/Hda family protein, partial [Pseudomonadota bacterium]
GAAPARAEGPPAPVLVEDGDRVAGHRDAEERLFHLINRQAAHGAPLLITARTRPGTWPVELPDLASRLATFAIAEIDVPDDVLLSSVLVKIFTDRQLKVSGEVIRYIALRIERSCAAAEDLVSLLDQASLEQKREITKRFVGEVTGWTA